MMLGLVAADANAAVTSKKYVDDALAATNTALTGTINTTKTELTEKITAVEGNVTTINQKLDGDGEGSVAKKIAAAVQTETERAQGEEGKIAKDLADYKTSNAGALANKADKSDTYTKKEVDDKDTALQGKIGTLTDLTTTAKTSAVEAINELDTAIDNIKAGTALADGAVTTNKIANTAVTADKIANDAVTTDKIANTAVTEGKIAADAVTTGKIKDGAVTADKIAADAVTTDKIKDGAVTSGKLAAVTTAGTGTKITYNAQGQVTKSEGLTAEDIPTLTAEKISNLNKLASAELPASCNQEGADCVLKFNGTTYTWEDIADTYTPAQQPGA